MPPPNPPVTMQGRARIAFCAEHGDARIAFTLQCAGVLAAVRFDIFPVLAGGGTGQVAGMDMQVRWGRVSYVMPPARS